jgi:ABC-type sugar transport system ATPase subunit
LLTSLARRLLRLAARDSALVALRMGDPAALERRASARPRATGPREVERFVRVVVAEAETVAPVFTVLAAVSMSTRLSLPSATRRRQTSLAWRLFSVLERGPMRRQARKQRATPQVNVPRLTGVPIAHLSDGQRQAVARARAAFWAKRAMLMDEPTAALGVRETTRVLKLARSIADRGLAVVMVSHILPHVMELADRIIVMRHGGKVAELTEAVSSETLVRQMVGLDAEDVVRTPQRRVEGA